MNPCTDKLTDIEYLEHMIPHHQVAIDMSKELNTQSITNPTILHLCRNIIKKQDYEIWEMTMVKQQYIDSLYSAQKGKQSHCKTKLDFYNPYMKTHKCNPLFFKPDEHKHHFKHIQLTPKLYLEHMIPHHQVAIDMSKRLLLHTTNSYLVDFCHRLIVDQQYEIVVMQDLLNNQYTHHSSFV